ncbi:MAG: hydantoinase/oxoprolinase family protein [Ramlibacter sp.]|nr:hydantoinase/oxoprolinase family protein [Ramlibacter sp.]
MTSPLQSGKESYSLGIDIGGTFTDVVLYSHHDARVFSHKELTTPEEPTTGAISGIRTLLEREQVQGNQVTRVVHATTLFTNALIERRGVRTGLIATEGFRDTLEMRREFKYDLYDLFIEMPPTLVPRESRLEARERMLADGSVDTPLDEVSVLAAGQALVNQGIESVAITFLHSYANPAHERRARDLLKQRFPQLYVSISCEVSPQIREYERTSTTAANAYVLPIADRYLERLEAQLKDLGIGCALLMMLSNGGLTHVGEARRFPVQLLESGPAAGAIAAAYFSKRSSIGDVLAFDMGGTTAKLAIVEDNQPLLAHSFEAAREKRFAAGSGIPINIATVELIEIGAGGGSIANLDGMNLLKVGPKSASSRPGPACYQRGGTLPTVTDANLLLGRLDAETFAGGTMKLSTQAARDALGSVAAALATGTENTADGVLSIVNENMAAAARVHVAERGFDASRFALLVTGGGGPLHGCDVARRLGIRRVVCPPGAGVASALGLLIAPARVDRSTTLARSLASVTPESLEATFAKLEADAAEVMRVTLVDGVSYRCERSADIRFAGQGFELVTRLPDGPFDAGTPALIREAFAAAYGRVFGQVPPVQDIELMNLRVAAIEEGVERPLNLSASGRETWAPGAGNRHMWQAGAEAWRNVPSLPRESLRQGEKLQGPAIVEDASSTLVIPANATAWRDAAGNLIVDLA